MTNPKSDADEWAEPLQERERIEQAYQTLAVCEECGADVPAWALETMGDGRRVCVPCATGQECGGEVF